MFASLFTTFFVQPIFNLLVFIYAILPGHNFGLAIIIFTIVIRWILYPLLKKQLHHTTKMRELQPLLKKIKVAAAGDRQKESALTMELYKEKEINPLASLGVVLVQLPLLLALFSGLRKIVDDPHQMVAFAYPWVRDLSWMKELASDISRFDNTLFGVIDLSKSALGNKTGSSVYWPALVIVAASSVTQFFQIRQTSPVDKDARSLRKILKEAGSGKVADSGEVNAAMGRNMSLVFPFFIFLLTVSFAAALSLYWFVGGLVAYIQQDRLLKRDNDELVSEADKQDTSDAIIDKLVRKTAKSTKTSEVGAKKTGGRAGVAKKPPIEAEIVAEPTPLKQTTTVKKRKNKRHKRKG